MTAADEFLNTIARWRKRFARPRLSVDPATTVGELASSILRNAVRHRETTGHPPTDFVLVLSQSARSYDPRTKDLRAPPLLGVVRLELRVGVLFDPRDYGADVPIAPDAPADDYP